MVNEMNPPRSSRLVPRPPPQLLSIVIPMYNEEEALPLLRARLEQLKGTWRCPVEFVLVDDGSSDNTFALALQWAQEDRDVKLVELSRNFGHQLATTAGLNCARGDAVVMMDADLQDPPELINDMIQGYCEGYDVVYGQRIDRQGETLLKLWTAKLFYFLMRKLMLRQLPANTGDFRLVSRRVLNDLKCLREHDRFLRGLITWVGYPQKALPYHRLPRSAGYTKYPLFKMVRLATNAIISFSDLPLRVIIWMGLFAVGASALMTFTVLYMYFFTEADFVRGYASLAVLICFFSGMILLALGMLGLYVGRIYTEVLSRPLYLVSRTVNLSDPPVAECAAGVPGPVKTAEGRCREPE